MKTKHVLSLAALAVCSTLGTSAMAQNVVNFEGYVVETACSAVAGQGGTVTLPSVEKAALATAGFLGQTEFPVALKDCDPSDATYQVNFSSATANASGRLPNQAAGGAKGVSLQLLSSTNEVLVVTTAPAGKQLPASIDPGIQVTGPAGIGSGIYKVRYYAETGVTVGEVKASAVMTLNYL